VQEQNGQLKENASQEQRELEQLRAESAKKSKRRAKNTTSTAVQCTMSTPMSAIPLPPSQDAMLLGLSTGYEATQGRRAVRSFCQPVVR
jgi:hypothetical protein